MLTLLENELQKLFISKPALNLIEKLPLELVGMNVLCYLSLMDIVMLERACGSKNSHQLLLNLIPYSTPVVLTTKQHNNREALDWFTNRRCKLSSLTIKLPGDNPCLHVKNLQVENFEVNIDYNTTIEALKHVLENKISYKTIHIEGSQNKEVIEQLTVCTRNVKQIIISNWNGSMNWLTINILTKWKLVEIFLEGDAISTQEVTIIVQTCTELTSMTICSHNIDDSDVSVIAQHCPKLETLIIYRTIMITYASLLALSDRGLPLKELDIHYIPNIPTTDIARRCSHALSCIHYLDTCDLHQIGQDASILIPYMTGLTSVILGYYSLYWLPSIIKHCHKLTIIKMFLSTQHYPVGDILSLCHANPRLQEFIYCSIGIMDTTLIELIQASPHLHRLYLPYETAITDIGILALSEDCQQLQELSISKCYKVTEVAVLQLLQRCRKLIRLYVSNSSLSEETWTQLDKNTQKRVRRW